MPQKTDKAPEDAFDPEEHLQRLVKDFEKWLRQEMPSGPLTLEEIEKRADRLGQEIKKQVQKQWLDLAGTGYVGNACPCSCGRTARYIAAYTKQVVTLCGVAQLRRAYYHCPSCRRGLCPLDVRLGLGRSQCTAAVRARL